MAAFLSIGTALTEASALSNEMARATLAACRSNSAFRVIELRRYEAANKYDVIVVDCVSDQVPSRNRPGIMKRERLALLLPDDPTQAPEVRALRTDFPVVPHLNHVRSGDPKWLCLSADGWGHSRRTWTPQKYLQRIVGWLAGTARETLHAPDQPVEQIYFDSPRTIVLPPDFVERVEKEGAASLSIAGAVRTGSHETLRAVFGEPDSVDIIPIAIDLGAIVHGNVESYPGTLGDLDDQLSARGIPFLKHLCAAVGAKVSGKAIKEDSDQRCLLVGALSIQREPDGNVERVEYRGFCVRASLASLGRALGLLHLQDETYHAFKIIGGMVTPARAAAWADLLLEIVNVRPATTDAVARRLSGVSDTGAAEQRVLAGVGALGSALAELWSREGWGGWTFVDPDYVQPHNTVRHLSRDRDVGRLKVDVVKILTDTIYFPGHRSSGAFAKSVLSSDAALEQALAHAALIVDATTTLEVPRELAQRAGPRMVSVFLNPTGTDSVLLLEDADRGLRLDAVEAQYYAAILGSDWGEAHLTGGRNNATVGTGCRDVSMIMSAESIQLHASVLAAQVRQLSAQNDARIRVWRADAGLGTVAMFDVAVSPTRIVTVDDWRVVFNEKIDARLSQLRREHAPRETGGVILGYVDHAIRSIYIVNVLPAPPDSVSEPSGFVRGVAGLEEKLREVTARTQQIVGYVGEWHSHPPLISAHPSGEDQLLLKHVSEVLMRDGEPALMVIVGSANEISTSVRGGSGAPAVQ